MFTFRSVNGGCELCRYMRDSEDKELEIPAEYMGEPVVRIGEKAFYCSDGPVSVHIPDTVAEIGAGAFFEMVSLEEVNIPGSVKTIEHAAFSNCASLGSVRFSEGLGSIGNSAFSTCENALCSVTLPKSLESLGDCAFDSCWYLENVTFLNPGTRFGKDVFYCCPNLPPETQLMGLVRSCDITRPIDPSELEEFAETFFRWVTFKNHPLMREEVFALAVKNRCLANIKGSELLPMFKHVIENGLFGHLKTAENGGMLSDIGLVNAMLDYSAEIGKIEMTAFLLDCKNRVLGFERDSGYQL